MPLPTPNLDDRKFQDILDEARRRIPQFCPEWTDHNLSDPGITMLELFAWMTDMLLYRLNRVPDKNYVKFLELAGITLEPARPATTDVTFRLSAPQPDDVVIPRGTEVATIRTETQEAITFTTDRDLQIRVPHLTGVLASRQGTRFHDFQAALDNPRQGLGVFAETPQPDDGLYLGFAEDLASHTVALGLHCNIEGIGVDPNDPPLAWETWDGVDERWVLVRLELDETGGLNRNGMVIVHLPVSAAATAVDGKIATWLRCRVLRPRPGQAGYGSSPRVTGIEVASIGGSVAASHTFRVPSEALGISDGTPGQTFQLGRLPVMPRALDEFLEVSAEDGSYEPWSEVRDFGQSGPEDPHYLLDDVTGVLQLGPRIRSPQGREQQFGRVPIAGRRLRFTTYRSGGGLDGNVGARTLTVLKSSIPYVAWASNLGPALGGTDSEDIEHAKWRGPQTLRALERAVTAEDFESLARRASSAVGRVRCVIARPNATAGGPGVVELLVIPSLGDIEGAIPPEDLELPLRLRREVEAFLDQRRLITTEVVIGTPPYTWVSVSARIRTRLEADRNRVARDAGRAIYAYLHPTRGGPEGQGWPFDRPLHSGEIYACLQKLPDVDFVEQIALQEVDPLTGEKGPPVTEITPPLGGLLTSHEHSVDVVTAQGRWT